MKKKTKISEERAKLEQHQDDLRKEALAFTDLLANQYFVKRQLDELPKFMCEHVSWIGTGEDEISRNLNEAGSALTKELAEYSGSFTIEEQWFEAVPHAGSICIVYGTLRAVPDNPALSDENLRLTLVLEKTATAMKLSHLHLSHPDRDQEQGHYYVSKAARSDRKNLQHTLELQSRQLEILNRNIPGGAHQCRNDSQFTLISMSDSFLSMLGYTRQEIKTMFHDRFIEMVHPADRDELIATTRQQLQVGREIELEYRILCKNGTSVWVLDRGRLLEDGDGGENFYCLLIEITKRKQAQEELRLSLERHQIIVDQATDIIFEWDIIGDTLRFSPNWRKRFGYEPIDTQISQRIPLSQNIHEKDMPIFAKIMKDIAAGMPYSEVEFRIRHISGQYSWSRIRATAQFNMDGRPIKAVGVIVDIDSEKRQRQALLDMAQRDALTGLYNKATTDSLVERRMSGGERATNQALLILDVDYFKLVNDTYGHLAGDRLLSDVAAVIKKQIRNTDVAGRIGGDEFLVYLTEVRDEEAVYAKAKELLSALETLVPEPGATPISCSIGAAVFPHGAIDYYALYKCADMALYARKKSGRGGVTLYHPDISDRPPCGNAASAVGADIGSDEFNISDELLAQYAFNMLYTAKDIESTIDRLLEVIGRSYDVSRLYIIERSEDGKFYANTFEWCAHGVASRITALQHISCEDVQGDYMNNFDQKGVFYCADVRAYSELSATPELKGIRSMLRCAMLDEGEFVGYVGFDEYRENCMWSPLRVATFKLTADVLSTFIVKMRQKPNR